MSNDPLIDALKARREAAGLSQEETANMIGVHLKTYQRIERGETAMKMSHYRILVEKLKTTDLDLSLDMLGVDQATPWDVAAAARTLPPEIRTVLVSMLMMIYRDKTPYK
ncbi:helix-turn-helix domain-containing protein [Vibrio sp. Isolate23]|uniref:helix-turn-helix domain-containing protein n=1 Tax=Vibrio sp. Isolate23 TaxID=2908533 RepID=UPI001EFE01AE|nr:helix-turn-helix transcriptional regulator [Vibrio sp. Isolate23]HCE2656937.1 helix-turn-helix transcriptional regulator [Vibrio parahaemolyticus]MCG9685109.1 helix-turn-helix domain-containing protein [Vibrio sp. Isolate23]HCE2923552.1 helix-turn-helix transcriptional regulator [Vibrio parahaemolyticus]HCH1769742.1 helix-turn-helix transcriptional regulator [Vibrio parahaemolyticus]HCH5178747.1 helix-turn-helix transcriptional regulator [Vibrio parahaemolyticus]